MRATLRLLAQVKYLEPGAPTGLTGIVTHAAPRSALLYLYNSTLDKLQRFPEHSVYRQSTEALTKHRLAIVESVKPPGLQEWQDRVRSTVQANPNAFHQVKSITTGEVNYVFKADIARGLIEDQLDAEDVGFEPSGKPEPEGPRTATEKAHHGRAFTENLRAQRLALPKIEPEPPLTSEQYLSPPLPSPPPCNLGISHSDPLLLQD